MSFFTGRVTALRFRVSGARGPTRVEMLEQLAANAIGKQRMAASDGVETGWIAGADILDTDFRLEKNVCGDKLFFALRIDANKLPSDLLKAYYQADLRALCANNPSGKPSTRQRREAKESARERLEQEAKDGRFLKRKAIELLWDLPKNELLFGASGVTHVDRLHALFKQTFGGTIEMKDATSHATEMEGTTLHVMNDLVPSKFLASSPADVAWVVDESSRDWLGNEFALWIWWNIECNSDEFGLSDASVLTVMPASVLVLDCPRGQGGNETIRHEIPTKLPEARKAIQTGKLPRRMGLMLVRHDQQYGFTLLTESLGIGAAKLPALEEEGDEARRLERMKQIDDLLETIDMLYAQFCEIRLSNRWGAELASMQSWLTRRTKAEAA